MPLHPQAKAFVDQLAQQQNPGWEELDPAESRELFSSLTALFGEGPDDVQVENRLIGDDLSIRIYRPCGDGPFPAVVFFHGGGWVLGDLDTHDALCRRLAHEADAVIVSVDYRRSPENTFPSALKDCVTATQFVANETESLQIDPSRIIVGGDSAGGNLAAAVAVKTAQEDGPKLCLQLLIYPVLDARCDSPSYHEFAKGFGLTQVSMLWFWEQYRGESSGTESVSETDPLLSPLFAAETSGLPPAHIVTAQYDVLRDEGEQYAQRLKDAGVVTTHKRYDGMIHGFIHLSGHL